MSTAKEVLLGANAKLAENKSSAQAIGAVYKFVVDGSGGGTFMMDLRDNPKIYEGDEDAPCTISMQDADCTNMLSGSVSPQELFFGGKLRIDGDMGLAMKLEPLMKLLR
jgi:putative sterol carrier protein